MSDREKIIKWAATALAVILAIGILIGIFGGLSLLFGMTSPAEDTNSQTGSSYASDSSQADDTQAGRYKTKTTSDSFDHVTSLKIDSLIYDVIIQTEDISHVQVDCDNVIENYVVEQKSDGTLKLYADSTAKLYRKEIASDVLSELVDLLDGKSTEKEHLTGTITITLPENCTLDKCRISGGTGALTISTLTCSTLDLDIGTGPLKGDLIQCSKFDLASGTGNIVLTNVIFNETDIDCGTGSVEISGRLLGDSDISCGVGMLDLKLEDSKDDYTIEIEKGLGSLTVDGKSFDGLHLTSSGARNHLEIEGGVGSINIDFGQSF